MNTRPLVKGLPESQGQALVEFSLVAFLMVMLLLAVVDFGNLVLTYNTISNGARVGTRYAIVHGSDNSATTNQIQGVVKNFLSAANINTASASVNVGYPDPVGTATSGCTNPGCRVTVTVTYQYRPLTSYFPLGVALGTTSQGVITF